MKRLLTFGLLSVALSTPAGALAAGLIPLSRAAVIAEQATGGRISEIELERSAGKAVYEVEIVDGGTTRELTLDAANGRILHNTRARFEGYWDGIFQRGERSALPRVKKLSELLAALERRSGGTARGASFDIERGKPYYEVELVTDIGVTDVYLDAASGAQLAFVPDD